MRKVRQAECSGLFFPHPCIESPRFAKEDIQIFPNNLGFPLNNPEELRFLGFGDLLVGSLKFHIKTPVRNSILNNFSIFETAEEFSNILILNFLQNQSQRLFRNNMDRGFADLSLWIITPPQRLSPNHSIIFNKFILKLVKILILRLETSQHFSLLHHIPSLYNQIDPLTAIWRGIQQGGEPFPSPICLCFLEHLAAQGVQLALLSYIMLMFLRERGQWDTHKDIHEGLSWVAGESGKSELSPSTRAFCPRLR